jgi:hypothetical protein
MKNCVPVCAVAVLCACSSVPEPTASPATPAAAAAGDEPLICHRERRVGTMFDTKVCRTQAEIDRDRAETQDWESRRLRHGVPDSNAR